MEQTGGDKKRSGKHGDAGVAIDKQFLERSNASLYIRDVLTKIVENRPDNPVGFLADYFQNLGAQKGSVSRACQQIRLTSHSKPAFHNNVVLAYEILGESRNPPTRGIDGKLYTELVTELVTGLRQVIREKLLKKIHCRDHEVVVFDVFRSSVLACVILEEFLAEAESLFKALDFHGQGKVEHALCDAVLLELKATVASTSKQDPVALLQTAHALAPGCLVSKLATVAESRSSKGRPLMTNDDFLVAATDAYLAAVKPLR